MSKYEPLGDYLRRRPDTTIRLAFAEVEAILGFALPPSAYAHSEWWSNNATGHSHARSWIEAGWATEGIDRKHRTVVFRRDTTARVQQGGPRGIFGRMKGTIIFKPDVDLTEPAGEVWNAELGILHE